MALRIVVISVGVSIEPVAGAAVTALEPLEARLIHREHVPPKLNAVRSAAQAWLNRAPLVLVCGGSGVGPHACTPEALAPLLQQPLPGIGELLRREAFGNPGAALYERCGGGVSGNTLLIWLPAEPAPLRASLRALAGPLGAWNPASDAAPQL